MKKLISLFAALLVAAGTLSVSSCATSHDDLTPVAYPGYIIGAATLGDSSSGAVDLWGTKAVPLKFGSDGVATYGFTVTQDMINNFWGAGVNNVNYKFVMEAKDGTAQIGKGESGPKAGGEYVSCMSCDTSIPIENVKVGNKYKVYIKVEGTKVSTKYELTSGEAAAEVKLYVVSGSSISTMNLSASNTYTVDVTATGTSTSLKIYDGTDLWGASSSTTARTDGTAVTLTKTNAKEVSFVTVEGGTYTITVDTRSESAYKVSITEKCYYVLGDGIPAGWEPANAQVMTKNSEGYFIFDFTPSVTDVEFKILAQKSWNDEGSWSVDGSVTLDVWTVLKNGATGKNSVITLDTSKKYTILLDVSSGDKTKYKVKVSEKK